MSKKIPWTVKLATDVSWNCSLENSFASQTVLVRRKYENPLHTLCNSSFFYMNNILSQNNPFDFAQRTAATSKRVKTWNSRNVSGESMTVSLTSVFRVFFFLQKPVSRPVFVQKTIHCFSIKSWVCIDYRGDYVSDFKEKVKKW